MDKFSSCFAFTLSAEGGYSDNPGDPGNWTGGVAGKGVLRGTKYGISAAAYPALDIVSLSEDDAKSIYMRDFYAPLHGDELQLPLALVAFDGAVNAGLRRSVTWLQQAAGVPADGVLGAATLQALTGGNAVTLAREALARRLDFYACAPGWPNFGLGWTRRVVELAGVIMN